MYSVTCNSGTENHKTQERKRLPVYIPAVSRCSADKQRCRAGIASVIHRKILGLVRNEKGARMFGNLMTCIMTWNLLGYNVMDDIVKVSLG